MAHTPGPWTISPHRSQFLIRQDSGPEEDVPYRLIGEAYRQADARLIAAAPEMLDGLKQVVAYYRHPTMSAKATMLRVVKAAIAKAEGGN